MLFPFVHLIMKDDNEAKSFTTGAMVSFLIHIHISRTLIWQCCGLTEWVTQMTVGWSIFTWYNIVVFPITEGPQWTRGFTANICLVFAWVSLFIVGYVLWQRDIKRGLYKHAIEEEENEEAFKEKVELEQAESSHHEHNEIKEVK